jgi:hypothetical protein
LPTTIELRDFETKLPTKFSFVINLTGVSTLFFEKNKVADFKLKRVPLTNIFRSETRFLRLISKKNMFYQQFFLQVFIDQVKIQLRTNFVKLDEIFESTANEEEINVFNCAHVCNGNFYWSSISLRILKKLTKNIFSSKGKSLASFQPPHYFVHLHKKVNDQINRGWKWNLRNEVNQPVNWFHAPFIQRRNTLVDHLLNFFFGTHFPVNRRKRDKEILIRKRQIQKVFKVRHRRFYRGLKLPVDKIRFLVQ